MIGANKYWTLITVVLIVVIITGGLVIWSKYRPSQPIEITLSPVQERPEGEIHVGKEESPQKVDLNRAEAWLLQALPGIGESRAQAIIKYRQEKGPFRQTSDLMKVEGIGPATYEPIKHLITVAE